MGNGLSRVERTQNAATKRNAAHVHHRCPEGSTWLHGRFCIFPPEEVQLRFCRFFPTPSTASCILASYCQVMVVVPTIIKSSQVFGNFIHPLSARTQNHQSANMHQGGPISSRRCATRAQSSRPSSRKRIASSKTLERGGRELGQDHSAAKLP